MRSYLRYKVYDGNDKFAAALDDLELGLVLVAHLGPGATLRGGHKAGWILFREGAEYRNAADSMEFALDLANRRLKQKIAAFAAEREAKGATVYTPHERRSKK